MGPQIQVPPEANLLFLNLSMIPFVTALQFQRTFSEIFLKIKETKLRFNGRKLSVGVWAFPAGERAQNFVPSMSDEY